ncbi:Tyrosine--tRNA ligase [Tritrichomonas foetus]|uniref:tyrosine--tRNA ligase n=1 Tax=Tritrichomonas foetus TaxID=1144522 RepID=A0A1J4KSP8_9EUKA|nr:Tyrosine--tRNA ligase [Tritrichomonas foetus]|eukprot:OHT13912.1 Tyrosine--tRNA ligase [Tritrichomonas foetus]
MTLSVEERKALLLSIAEDVQGADKLDQFLSTHEHFRAYNGFEPSGRMHIAQALMTAINTNAITKAGGTMVLYIADIFALLNHKMGGDINKIHDVGLYFIEVFKACGMDLDHVEFIWAKDFIQENQVEYFNLVNNISAFATLNRIKRTVQIMGRKEGDNLSLSQLIYPCMQAADVFMLNVDFCQLGVDQRKVNMLAIEYANSIKRTPPMILSHHMLMGLKGKAVKMSKSDPEGAIFIEDTREDVFRKVSKAVCPAEANDNPLFEYLKYIIMKKIPEVTICGKTYTDSEQVKENFAEIVSNEAQFRDDVANYIDMVIQPIREHFQKPELQDLLKRVESYRVTR